MNALPEPESPAAPQALPFVPTAGTRPGYYPDPRAKSPITATVLSLMPGLGQVYLGYTQLGFIHAATAAIFIALMSSNQLGRLEPFFGVSMTFFFLYNLVDAHRRALLLNERLAQVAQVESPLLPDGFGSVSFGGRLGAGVLLIVGGVLSLLHLRFGVSLAWLADWWPLGLVGFGVYLVVRTLQERAASPNSEQA